MVTPCGEQPTELQEKHSKTNKTKQSKRVCILAVVTTHKNIQITQAFVWCFGPKTVAYKGIKQNLSFIKLN
jgi:hypothetical protein